MKLKKMELLFPTLIALTLALLSLAHADEGVTSFTEAPQYVFTPKGFDDNDNVQVVLEGNFGNFCFHTAPAQVQIDGSRIYIDNTIYSMDHCVNALMYIPYTRVVDIGVLPVGNYEVWISDGVGNYQKRATLPVVKSRPSLYTPDDELYAPVTEVSFQAGQNGSDPSLTVRGSLNNTCLTLGNIQVKSPGGNVIEVLPQANLVRDAGCASTVIPFSKTVTLSHFPAKGDVLLHVRSMGGQSVNRVVTELDRAGL